MTTRALLWGLLGCTGAGGPSDTGTASASSADTAIGATLPWVTDTEAEPLWTAEQAALEIALGLAEGLPEPRLPMDTYLGLMAQGDADCPGHSTQLKSDVLYGCESAAGIWFEGISMYGREEGEGGVGSVFEFLSGDFVIQDVDGRILEVGGHVVHSLFPSDGGYTYGLEFVGSWLLTPSETFLDPMNSLVLDVTLDSEGLVVLAGGWGRGGIDLFFDVLSFDGSCEGHATGTVQIRDSTGTWYALTLQDSCTGCGEVIWGGTTSLGEACVDLRATGDELASTLQVGL